MRILDRPQFLAIPAGVLYSLWQPGGATGDAGSTCGLYQTGYGAIVPATTTAGDDEGRQYAIYEEPDLDHLRAALERVPETSLLPYYGTRGPTGYSGAQPAGPNPE